MATLTQMETEVGYELGLAATTAGTEKTLVDGWLNEGVVDILRRTACYATSATMTETAGTGDYTLDTDIIRVLGWSWSNGSTTSEPERVTPQEILRLRAATSVSSAVTATYYAVAGSNLLMVWPTPAGADTITIYHVPRPTAMSSASHDPSNATYGGIPVEFHPAIVKYAEWQGGSAVDDQSSAQGERYRQQYFDWVKEIRKSTRQHGGALGRAIVNAKRRRRTPRDNSTDIRNV